VDITGCVFSDKLNEVEITKKSDDALIRQLNDTRMGELVKFWDGKIHDGFSIHAFRIPCDLVNQNENNAHEDLHGYVMSKKHEDSELNEKITMLVDHLVKTVDFLYFASCDLFGRPRCEHCQLLPPPHSMMNYIKENLNGILPFPIPSTENSDHFLSFLEIPKDIEFTALKGNFCDTHKYHFDSDADMRRHFDICHDSQPTKSYCKDYFVCARTKNKVKCAFKCDLKELYLEHIEKEHNGSNKSKTQKDKPQFFEIQCIDEKYCLEGVVLTKGMKVDADFTKSGIFCGTVTNITKNGRAQLYFESDSTKNTFKKGLRLCKCFEK